MLWKSLLAALFAVLIASSPAGSGSMMLLGAGKTSAGGGGCAEATAFTSLRSGTTGNAAYTTAICALVTAGIYAKLDTLYIFGQDTQANSQINLIQTVPGSYNAVLATAPNWAAGSGGAGGFSACCGDYITSINPGTAAPPPQFQRNSASIFIWVNSTAAQVAGLPAASDTFIYANNSGSTFFGGINNVATYSCSGTGATSGLFTITRTGASAIAGYVNGSSVCTASDASTPVPNSVMSFGRGDGSTTSAQYIVGGIGAGLSPTDVSTLYSTIHTLLQTIAGYP